MSSNDDVSSKRTTWERKMEVVELRICPALLEPCPHACTPAQVEECDEIAEIEGPRGTVDEKPS